MRTILSVLILTLSGCTAIKSSVHLVQAEQAVTRAEQRNADDEAIYEYTMSMRYLEKAREENGYSDYKDSAALSKAAVEWAEKAAVAVEMGGSQYTPPARTMSLGEDEGLPDGSDEPLEGDLPDEPPASVPASDGDLPAGDDLLEDE